MCDTLCPPGRRLARECTGRPLASVQRRRTAVTTNPPPAHGDPRTRAVLAGYAGDRAAARGLLTHADPSVRASALGALDRMGQIQPADLRSGLADPDSLVR